MILTATRKGLFTEIRTFAMMLAGSAILAFGLFNIHNQSQITEGGVLGMTLLFQNWFHISPGFTGPMMDIVCYIIACKMLGRQFLKYALVATAGFAIFYNIFETMGPILPNLGDTPVLAAIAGGLFVGTGVGLIVRCGGASGGDDALALIISKFFKCKLSLAYFATDFAVLLLSLTYVPVSKILCSLITVTLSSFIIGRIHAGGMAVKPQTADGMV